MPLIHSIRRRFASLPMFLLATVCVALVLRFLVVALVIPIVSENTFDHNEFGWEMGWVARSIALGQGFSSPFLPQTGPTALVPPIYPYLVAGLFKVFGLYTPAAAFAILGFNSLCSALTCVPLYFVTRNLLNDRIARITAFGWAVYPFAIYFSADRVWDYALTSLLFVTCLLISQKLHLRGALAWAGFGALYGLAILSNPSIATMFPVLLLIAAYKVWRVGGAWPAKALLAVVAFTAVCTPWALRNRQAMHAGVFLRDGFWVEFYAGNNGDTYESNSAWAHPASNAGEMQKWQQMGEVAYIEQKHQMSLDFIKQRPGFVAVATVHRIVRFWTGWWTFNPAYLKNEPMDIPNVPFCLFLLWATVRGLRRFWAVSPLRALPYLATVLIFPIPYYLTHASMDYRQPIEPVLILLVCIGLFGVGNYRRSGVVALDTQLDEATM